jgi:hypothetical protein
LALAIVSLLLLAGQALAAPTITVDPTPSAAYATAHISGTIDPGEEELFYFFQYSHDPDSEGWSSASFQGPLSASSGVDNVSDKLTGLKANTEYKLRLTTLAMDFFTETSSEPPFVTFTTDPVAPPTVTIDPVTSPTATTAHFSGTIDPNSPEAAPASEAVEAGFKVNWHFQCSPECPSLSGGTVAAQQTAEGVEASATGLEPNTHYQVTLVGDNAGDPITAGPVSFTTTAVAPTATTLSAFALEGGTSALVGGRVNPKNSPTTYWVEYGTDTSYGQNAPGGKDAVAGEGGESTLVRQTLTGLTPGTTYHFRLVVRNGAGEVDGGDLTLTTAPAAPITAGRGYEEVTPSDKDFSFGQFEENVAISSTADGAVAYNTFGPLPGSQAGTFANYYIGRRGPTGWTSRPISPPQETIPNGTNYPVFQGYSADLSQTVFKSANPILTPEATPNVTSLYRGNNDNGANQLLSPGPATFQHSQALTLGGASQDFTHVVFEAFDPLVEGAPSESSSGVYEWIEGEGLRNIAILPGGIPAGEAVVGNGANGRNRLTHAISTDGRRIVFALTGNGGIYDRIDGTSTTPISESQRTPPDPNGAGQTEFWLASANGGRVFFTSREELTDDANTGSDGSGNPTDAGNDLYEYDLASGLLKDLSVDSSSSDVAAGADVQGILGGSDDGEYIYFVALGNLGGGAVPGQPNLYLRHGDATRYIATLDPADGSNWQQVAYSSNVGVRSGITSRVASDGRNLVFQSVAPLTGYDNTDSVTGAADGEVFLYSTVSGLSCASCRPDGRPPSGVSTVPPPTNTISWSNNLTPDGSRVFFDSDDAIVPEDTNGRWDVYEFADGEPRLVSNGTSRFDSHFWDASPSGTDVYFSTRAQLVPWDTDQYDDLYDARVNGGFPAPGAAVTPCQDESCQAEPTAVPASASPGSAGLSAGARSKEAERRKAVRRKRAKALKACRSKHPKAQRKKCEARAKRHFAKQAAQTGRHK